MPSLFIDLDGVLADFDGAYGRHFGALPDRTAALTPEFWPNIRRHGQFFRDLPPMPDMTDLWVGALALHRRPVILSGVPPEVPDAADQKRAWIDAHLGADVPAIFCKSRDKRRHGKPDDVLIDDWVKYRHLWERMGGVFVLHRSTPESLSAAREALGI